MADREHREWQEDQKLEKRRNGKKKRMLPPPPPSAEKGGGSKPYDFDPILGF